MMVHLRSLMARVARFAAAAAAVAAVTTASPAVADPLRPSIVPNDNRHPAGKLDRGTLTLARSPARAPGSPKDPGGRPCPSKHSVRHRRR